MFAPHIGDVVEKMTTLAGSAAKPAEYRKRVLNRLIPIILPYEPDTWAAFSYANFNGRTFTDDVMGVQLSLMTNAALGDDVSIPARPRKRRVPVLRRAQHGHVTRYGVPTTWLAGLARLPSGPPELARELMQAVAANDEAAVRRRAHMTRR